MQDDLKKIIQNEKINRAVFLEGLYKDRWKEDRRNWKVASKLSMEDRKRFDDLTRPGRKWK